MDSEPPEEIKEIDGDALDRLVAEKIFGFQVRTRTVMFSEYTQVIGRDAEEPWCPICGNDNFCIVDKGQIKGVFPPY